MSLALEGDRLLAAGHWVLAESRDGGRGWRNLRPQGLPALDLHGYAVRPGLHFALEATYGYALSRDGGKRFTLVAPKGLPKAGMAAMAFVDNILYVAPMGKGLYQSQDEGKSFSPVTTPEAEVYALAAGAGGFYLGGKGGLWQRTAVGWKRLWAGTVLALAAHPQSPSRLVWIDEKGRVWTLP